MKIWIENKIGFLQGYSEVEQPYHVVVEISSTKGFDFTNWKYDGQGLIHDIENAPVIEEPSSEIEQLRKENELLKKGLEETNERQDTTDATMLELADIVFGGGE